MQRKVMTVLGGRPEIIRLSRIVETLDRCAEHVVVAVGHDHDPELGELLFDELGVRAPDHHLGIDAPGSAGRIGQILERIESVLQEYSPDRLLVIGDADSGLSALVAKKLGIHVVHMDAGNRCFDDRVPEEVNRRVIDHSSDLLLPYAESGRRNLIAEGIPSERIMVVGNPILEVIEYHEESIAVAAERVIERLEVTPGEYLLFTIHRQETIESEDRLRSAVEGVIAVGEDLGMPVVASVHPRTRARLDEFGIDLAGGPFGFFDFVALEMGSHLVFTDSVTVQEECCLFGVPAVTLRDTTERPETLECGSNILSGIESGAIERAAKVALDGDPEWTPPEEYQRTDVSSTVVRLLMAGG